MQALIEMEASEKIGAGKYERNSSRTMYRNGYRERALDTRVGSPNLRIPKLREGAHYPSLLEPRKMT